MPVLRDDCVRLAFHPPLYPALLAPLARLTGTTAEGVLAGHELNPAHATSKVVLSHGYPDEAFPYGDSVRFVHLARLATLIPALFVLAYTHLLARRGGADGMEATLAVVVVSAIPQFQYLAASVNHDALVAAFGAAFLLQCFNLAKEPSARGAFAGGIALGGGLLAKSSMIALMPLPLLSLACHLRKVPLARLFRAAALLYGVAGLLAGWWYVRKIAQDGSLLPPVYLPETAWIGTGFVRSSPMTATDLIADLTQLFQSFWFLPGLMNISAARWMYACWLLVSMIGAVGMLAMLRDRSTVVLVAGFILCVAGILEYNRVVYSAQGRYLFVVLPVIGVAVARGLAAIVPASFRRTLGVAMMVVLTVVAVTAFVACFAPVYSGIPERPAPAGLATAQLYCGNEYRQLLPARGGTLRGIELSGRRYGRSADYAIELRLFKDGSNEALRVSTVAAAMVSAAPGRVLFSFPPLPTTPGERYALSLRAPAGTPFARTGFAYRVTDSGTLTFNGTPIQGELDLDELSD